MSIHSQNEAVILEFGLHKPAFRIVVNTSTSHGSIGLTTGLDPAMTLGCGGFGGNITSDNISPRHLLNIKRLAYGIRELPETTGPRSRGAAQQDAAPLPAADGARPPEAPALPKAPSRPPADPVAASTLSARIDQFLASRGVSKPGGPSDLLPATLPPPAAPASPATATPVAFVCEDDVRVAKRDGRTILVNERTIITPSARDVGESARIFVWEGWRP
jgi:hypothetical protein